MMLTLRITERSVTPRTGMHSDVRDPRLSLGAFRVQSELVRVVIVCLLDTNQVHESSASFTSFILHVFLKSTLHRNGGIMPKLMAVNAHILSLCILIVTVCAQRTTPFVNESTITQTPSTTTNFTPIAFVFNATLPIGWPECKWRLELFWRNEHRTRLY